MGHRRMLGKGQSSSCPSYVAGKYTAEEVDDLVFVQGYIPVATEAEFTAVIGSGTPTRTMGLGTCWEGTYTLGRNNKKYVQVEDITFISTLTPNSGVWQNGAIYDGNFKMLLSAVVNVGSTTGLSLFALSSGTGATIRNVWLDVNVIGTAQSMGGISGTVVSGHVIEDCYVQGTNSQTGANGRAGGAVGTINAGAIIRRCVSAVTINNPGATGTNYGGLVGLCTGTIENCIAYGSVNARDNCGGLVGGTNTGCSIVNSFCYNTVAGNSFLGGLVGRSFAGTASNSYWDTTIGLATSPLGTGQTTVALQTPTSNTGIYSAWTIPPWNFSGVPNYPNLTTTP